MKFEQIRAGASAFLLITAIFWSFRLAGADYDAAQSDLPHLERACRLAPNAANYWLRASAIREIDAPDDPAVDAAIARALELNPRYTEAWMVRALHDEMHGRVADAERDYLAAAGNDRMYKPAWALANFYVRQSAPEKFWAYARKCLEVVEPRRFEQSSYDPSPVFDLAWRVSQDPTEIRRRLIPPRHFILVDYLDYLTSHNLIDAAVPVAMDLPAYADAEDNYFLLNFCERLINSAKARAAVDLWNAMGDHQLVRADHLDPEVGRSLSNADLKRPFSRAGFDWRFPIAAGVLQSHFADSGEVQFEFSGDQPDGVVFYESIPVVPGEYRISFEYRTAEINHTDGLTWQIWDQATWRAIPINGRLTPHANWSAGEARFTVPAGVALARLDLASQRETGNTRVKGAASFRGFSLQLVRKDARKS